MVSLVWESWAKSLAACWNENEVGPAGAHASGTGVGRGVSFSVGFRNGTRFVGSEVVPEVLEVNPLASLHQGFRCRPVETEVPDCGIVVDRLPRVFCGSSADAASPAPSFTHTRN